MNQLKNQLEDILQNIDQLNAEDPKNKELLYSQRMSKWLDKLQPGADPLLKIAVRAQHLQRWKVLRTDYPATRAGYRTWRIDCAAFHARAVGNIMMQFNCDSTTIEAVQKIVRKEDIKSNKNTQTLENCAALVFLDYYFDAFIHDHRDYTEEKMLKIITRTWTKMSDSGHKAAKTIEFSPEATIWIKKALSA